MKKVLLAILFAVSFLVLVDSPNVFAVIDPAFKTLNYKLAHDPVICVLQADDKNIPEARKKLSEETKYAIIDWQTKLKDTTKQRYSWNLETREIKSNEIDSYDFSNCDIQIHFKSQPEEKEEKFDTLGVTYLDKETLSPIVEIYYLQIDPGIEYKSNARYYWYEYHPSYLNILRTDDQLASTIRHELGHSFGLGHYMAYDKSSNDNWKSGVVTPPSIMIPLQPDSSRRVDITPLDIDKMVSIYGDKGFGNNQENNTIHTIQSPYLLKSYESDEFEFSIKYPADWVIVNDQNTDQNDSIISFNDNLQNPNGFLDVALIKNNEDKIPNDIEYLDSVTQLIKDDCENMTFETGELQCSNFTILHSKIMEINSKKAYQIKYFRTFIDTTGAVSSFVSAYTEIPTGNNLWVIYAQFYSYLNSDFAGEIDSSINSFKVNSDETQILTNNPEKNTETESTVKNELSVKSTVPLWIKNNAKWWADGQINDSDFLKGIEYLINNNILKVNKTVSDKKSSEVPAWIKNNAKWWSEDKITETDFIKGIEHLVKTGIIKVN
jgi:hypothetical protein